MTGKRAWRRKTEEVAKEYSKFPLGKYAASMVHIYLAKISPIETETTQAFQWADRGWRMVNARGAADAKEGGRMPPRSPRHIARRARL
jgi:hypothetical protein